MESNAKDEMPPVDAATQAKFDQGHEVGAWAHKLFPGGVMVGLSKGFGYGLSMSRFQLRNRKPLFEAGFTHGHALAFADVLDPVGNDEWDLIEVKSSTSVKDINIQDVALQRYCFEGAGLKIRRCILMYINNQYVRHGEVDPQQLFTREDITDRVEAVLGGVEGRLVGMAETVAQPECPTIEIGPHCTDPYECPLKERCWAHVLKYEENIFTLPRIGAKAWDLYRKGILRNADLPPDMELTEHQRIQVEAERTGRTYVEGRKLSEFLQRMSFPLHYLDFETFSTAIPLVDGVRPYQKVPFQFSLHVEADLGADPVHHSWIWDGVGDPRSAMLDRMGPLLGDWGSIVAYNATFEKGILHDALAIRPDPAPWAEYLDARMVDLLEPFRDFLVYDSSQHGSASLKAVVPFFTDQTYEGREIADGATASQRYLTAMFTDVDPAAKQRTMRLLEEYCGVDTLGMVELVASLVRLA
jgi:hypothetical protein